MQPMNTAGSMFIGHKIKKLRELKNLTQDFMAAQLDITQSGYSRLENNEVDLPFSKLERIAEVFEMKPEDIIAFDEKYVFNQMHNQTANAYGLTINSNNQYSEELTKLSERLTALENLIKEPGRKNPD